MSNFKVSDPAIASERNTGIDYEVEIEK